MFRKLLRLLVLALFIPQSSALLGMYLHPDSKIKIRRDQQRLLISAINDNFEQSMPKPAIECNNLYVVEESMEKEIARLESLTLKRFELLSKLPVSVAIRVMRNQFECIKKRLHQEEVNAWNNAIKHYKIIGMPAYEDLQKQSKKLLMDKSYNEVWDKNLPLDWKHNLQEHLAENGIKESCLKVNFLHLIGKIVRPALEALFMTPALFWKLILI